MMCIGHVTHRNHDRVNIGDDSMEGGVGGPKRSRVGNRSARWSRVGNATKRPRGLLGTATHTREPPNTNEADKGTVNRHNCDGHTNVASFFAPPVGNL